VGKPRTWGRLVGKFNLNQGDVMDTIEIQVLTETKLRRIAWLSKSNKAKEFGSLMHHFNAESLEECFHALGNNKAVGVDKVRKEQYGVELENNLQVLLGRMKQMQYRPEAVREVLIAKDGKAGATRPLGISNFEDKIVQKMMHRVLEAVYEPIFLDCSYGFRPGRGCHDAIRDLRNHLYNKPVETVLDIDIQNFFGSICHRELEKILRQKIKDTKLMRYIIRMFKAGILKDGELSISDEGIMQGSACSPIMANVFAHYVIDEWFEEVVKKHCRGEVRLFRYCDDLCICCQYESDAVRIRTALGKRLAKFKLQLNEEKTKLVSFCDENKREGRFDFLGFTFYWGKSRYGKIIPMVKTARKRMNSKLKGITQWIKERRNKCKMKIIWQELKLKIEGHIRYYGVSFNMHGISTFIYSVKCIIFKWLNRRSQRKSFNWDKFAAFITLNPLPKARICHKLF
jgi:RNA-directed DNA polymerase